MPARVLAPGRLPAGLREQVFAAIAVQDTSVAREGMLRRLGSAARNMLEQMRESADTFVIALGAAAADLMRVVRIAPAAEMAYAYDGGVATEANCSSAARARECSRPNRSVEGP